ncbi:hypothetical protein GW17_00059634, partial [Ensete ventricosum]
SKGAYRGGVGVGRRATACPPAALLGDHLPPSGGSVLRRIEGAAAGGGDGRLQLAHPGHGSGNDCRLASGGNGKGGDDDDVGGEYEKYRAREKRKAGGGEISAKRIGGGRGGWEVRRGGQGRWGKGVGEQVREWWMFLRRDGQVLEEL